MIRKSTLLALAALCVPLGVNAAGSLGSFSGSISANCDAASAAAYNNGYSSGVGQGQSAGFQQGFDTGYPQGYDTGANDKLQSCQGNPESCGIFLSSCIAAPTYGETEPNDNIVAADLLVLDTKFWGQSYGSADQDWFYVVTSAPNQTLTLNFSVPGGSVAGWMISIRDAAGNVFVEFDTSAVGSVTTPDGAITYRATLGLVGTYYVVVKPALGVLSYAPYNLAAILQDSPLETPNYVIGFFDVEVEQNDNATTANPVATGVTRYGLINLAFDPSMVVRDLKGDGFEYAQGYDADWYKYVSEGNEIIALDICARNPCETGQWLFQVYNEENANLLSSGTSNTSNSGYVWPVMAYNSEAGKAEQVVFGIKQPGTYYMRVTHKRLLTAACAGYNLDTNNDGSADGGACRCDSGASCTKKILNPGGLQDLDDDDTTPEVYPPCPDGSGGGASSQCDASCVCTKFSGVIEVPANALTSQYNFTWFSTKLPPDTSSTEAYQEFLARPSPY